MFNTFIYEPLYNALIALMHALPWADVGVVIIAFTILVRLVLFPLAQRAVKTQIAMKDLQPKFEEIKGKFKDNKQKQAEETMRLYREEKVNPFASFLVLLIQLPIVFGLYFVFLRGGLPMIDLTHLYSFLPVPSEPAMTLFGIIDISGKSVVLALLVGITQYIQVRFAAPPVPPKKRSDKPSFKDDIARSMHLQMRYVMPVIVAIIAYTLSALIGLYWTTTNLFTIGQELYVRKRWKQKEEKSDNKSH
jgi:YidC/Oxa1 family membrane protein insertase